MRLSFLAFPILALAACEKPPEPKPAAEPAPVVAPAPAATPQVFTWTCPNGKSFTVAFDGGFTAATVTTDKATYTLPAAISASGSRYTDGTVEFWEHQGESMLNGVPGETYEACKTPEP